MDVVVKKRSLDGLCPPFHCMRVMLIPCEERMLPTQSVPNRVNGRRTDWLRVVVQCCCFLLIFVFGHCTHFSVWPQLVYYISKLICFGVFRYFEFGRMEIVDMTILIFLIFDKLFELWILRSIFLSK